MTNREKMIKSFNQIESVKDLTENQITLSELQVIWLVLKERKAEVIQLAVASWFERQGCYVKALNNGRYLIDTDKTNSEKEKFFKLLNALRKALVKLNEFYASYHKDNFNENDYLNKAEITFTDKSLDDFNEEIIDYIDRIIG